MVSSSRSPVRKSAESIRRRRRDRLLPKPAGSLARLEAVAVDLSLIFADFRDSSDWSVAQLVGQDWFREREDPKFRLAIRNSFCKIWHICSFETF